jgi:hypothetical protein
MIIIIIIFFCNRDRSQCLTASTKANGSSRIKQK